VQTPKSIWEKLWMFGESPLTWGAVGMLLGAVAAVVSLKVLFICAGVILVLGMIRVDFFEGRTWAARIIGSALLGFFICLALILVWLIVPKPKQPASAEEIASEVRKKLEERPIASISLPPSVRAEQPEEKQRPSTANIKPPKGMGRVPKLTAKQSSAATVRSSAANPPPAIQAHLTITQSQKISTRMDAPVETEVVIQTDNTFPSLKLVMQCDKPLVDAQPTIGGAVGVGQMATSFGILREHPNIFVYSYGLSIPPFGPANPLVIDVWSKEPVTCGQVATF
jgi:hypothetical protein